MATLFSRVLQRTRPRPSSCCAHGEESPSRFRPPIASTAPSVLAFPTRPRTLLPPAAKHFVQETFRIGSAMREVLSLAEARDQATEGYLTWPTVLSRSVGRCHRLYWEARVGGGDRRLEVEMAWVRRSISPPQAMQVANRRRYCRHVRDQPNIACVLRTRPPRCGTPQVTISRSVAIMTTPSPQVEGRWLSHILATHVWQLPMRATGQAFRQISRASR